MPAFDAKILINKYREGNCTPEEEALVEHWYEQIQEGNFDLPESLAIVDLDEVWRKLGIIKEKSRLQKLWAPIKIVASIAVILGIGVYFYTSRFDHPVTKDTIVADIQPGADKAVLILADGRKISLNDAVDGELAKQGNTSIVKTADGELVYSIDGRAQREAGPLIYNTIETPKGGKYHIRLPDGSVVWLNAASTLKYPTSFNGQSVRRIEMTGEAYFEVVHNTEVPFVVKTGTQEVQVLGTRFNINGYSNELSVNTTLIAGSVKVSIPESPYVILKPNQQAIFVKGDLKVKEVDADGTISWVNGDFNFKDENIRSIMRKLERWYDIDVVYEGNISDVDFGAEISRKRTLLQVLKILEKTGGVHFKVEGRRITVMQ